MKIKGNIEKHNGVFTEFPSTRQTTAAPDGPLFGNGDIGVAVCAVQNDYAEALDATQKTLAFRIGKNDFWHATWPQRSGSCTAGCKGFGILKLYAQSLQDVTFRARQVLATADVEIDLEDENQHLYVSAYAPYQQNLVILKVQALKGDIALRVSLQPLEDEAAEYTHRTKGNLISITKDYVRDVEWETKGAGFCRIPEWERTDHVLNEGEQITVIVSVVTNHDAGDYMQQAENAVLTADSAALERMRQQHLEWWEAFWVTSAVSIPSEPEIEKFWYGSHYLMACCSKAGKFAPGLYGNWITTNRPNWHSDYHLNYNYQASWWGVFSSNKVFLAEPYDLPLMDMIPDAQNSAQKFLGCRGIYAKVGIGPKGLVTERMFRADGIEVETLPFLGQKSNAAYAAVNMVMRFYSTWDAAYAEKYALPYLLELADFWEDYLTFEDGRYVIYNDCIHENAYEFGEAWGYYPEGWIDYKNDFNPVVSLGLVRMVFGALLDITAYLDKAADRREKWQHILSHISAFPTQQRAGKTVFRYTERGMDWCDSNSLGVQHIFPCGAIGLSSEPALLQTAKNTVEVMGRWTDFNAFPTFFAAAARVGYDPHIITEKLKEQFLKHAFPNLFIYFGGGGIECCSAVPVCINEMLLQSHEGVVRLFPVWEKDKDAAFSHLRGYGAFLVSARLSGGVVEDVTVFSEKGRPCRILCPWEAGMDILADGSPVSSRTEYTQEGVIYAFDTVAGKEYRLQPK